MSYTDGAVLVEDVYNMLGLGRLLFKAAFDKNYSLVLSIVLIAVLVFVITNLIVDMIYPCLNPRIEFLRK